MLKRCSQLLLVAFTFLHIATAQTKLAGYVVEINSGKARVPGVNVKSLGANNIITTNQGLFTLVFPNAQPGKPVLINAQKEGWQVVNPKELNTILPEKPDALSLKITMCKAGYLENAKKEYYQITDNYIVKEFNKRLQTINKEKEGWQKEAAELEEKLQLLNKQINEMAEEFSIINLDDLNETERKAVELFKTGHIDSSIKLRESLHSGEEIRKAVATKKQLDSTIAANAYNLKQLANEYILKYDFTRAEKTLEELALADTSNYQNASSLADFLAHQNRHDKAIQWNLVCLRIARKMNKSNPAIYETEIAAALNDLGLLYNKKNNYTAAETAYKEALNIRRRLVKTNPETYEDGVALILNNSGNLYKDKNNYTAAEAAYKEALDIRKQLAKTKPEIYEKEVALIQNNLGTLYLDKNNYSTAEAAFKESLEIFRQLAKNNPATYEPELAMAQNNLGILYKDNNNYIAAEAAYKESLEIRRRLAKLNPAMHEPDLATVQNNLGLLYYDNNNPLAEAAFNEALTIYSRLAKTNPETYESDIAVVQNNLGILYQKLRNYLAAEAAHIKSLEIGRRLAKTNPETYEPHIAIAQTNLGQLYNNYNKYEASELAYLEALEIRKRLAKTNPEIYEPDLAIVFNNLGNLYSDQKNYPAAKKAYEAALEIRKRFAQRNYSVYGPFVAITLNNLGGLYYVEQQYDFAEKAYLEALEIFSNFEKNNPAKFKHYIDGIQINLRALYYKTDPEIPRIEFLRQKKNEPLSNTDKINVQQEIVTLGKKLAVKKEKKYILDLGNDLGSLAWYLIFDKQFEAAESAARQALFPSYKELPVNYAKETEWVNTNLAIALLFQGKYAEAEKIYSSLKNNPYENTTFKEIFLADLDELEKAGITHKDVEKIRAFLRK
ncbi:MAG: tetratricopeptide repeat protein [Chitinophagaceae bacterium]